MNTNDGEHHRPQKPRRQRASVVIVLDDIERPSRRHYIVAEDLDQQRELEPAARAAFEALCAALEAE